MSTLTNERSKESTSPSRRLVAAGIKRGSAAWLVEQPMTQADRERHTARCYGLWAAATNFRRFTSAR